MPSVKELKSNVKKILSCDFILHMAAVFLPTVCFFALIYTGFTIADLFWLTYGDAAFYVAFYMSYILSIALTVPLIYGYAVFQTNCLKHGKADFSDMFYAFSSVDLYCRSFRLFYAMLWRFALVFAAPSALIYTFIMYNLGEKDSRFFFAGYDFAYTLYLVLIVVTITAAFLFFCRFTTAMYITVTREEQSVSQCFFAAMVYHKNCQKRLYALAISFVPLMIAAYISFGILLIYVLPLIFTAFFMFSHERYHNNAITEQTIKTIFN